MLKAKRKFPLEKQTYCLVLAVGPGTDEAGQKSDQRVCRFEVVGKESDKVLYFVGS